MTATPSPPAVAATRAYHPYAILATCCLSLFLVTMDVTIVNVALPAIRRDFAASMSDLQWAIDAYTLVIASFLMLAGSAADRFGRRRVFQLGLGLFSAGSLSCSLATNSVTLVACRAFQACGGAMLNPVAMSIITNTFTDSRERARAIGLWGAVVGISMALGPILGGLLTQFVGWRSIFWINVPVGLVAIGLAQRFIPESRGGRARRFDPVGQGLVIASLSGLTSGLIEGPRRGWLAAPIMLTLATALAAVIALLVYERRRHEPLIDFRFFRSLPFASATATAVVVFIGFSGFLFLNALYLQEVRLMPASRAGLCMLPIAMTMALGSPVSGRLVGAGRARLAMVTAGLAVTVAAGMLTGLSPTSSLPGLVVAYAVLGTGIGLANAPITHAAVSGMPRAQAGLAAAMASTSRQVGASLGVALAGAIAGHTRGEAFAASTRPFWWLMAGCGLTMVALGLVATGARARASVATVAPLLDVS